LGGIREVCLSVKGEGYRRSKKCKKKKALTDRTNAVLIYVLIRVRIPLDSRKLKKKKVKEKTEKRGMCHRSLKGSHGKNRTTA